MYRRPFSMNSYCFHCGLKFEREQGYFVGAIYINYAATVAIAVPGFFLLDAFTHMTIHQQLAIWVPFLWSSRCCFSTIRGAFGWCWIIYSTQPRVSTPCRQKHSAEN